MSPAPTLRRVGLPRRRFMPKRMGATAYEVESSHIPMLSDPDLT